MSCRWTYFIHLHWRTPIYRPIIRQQLYLYWFQTSPNFIDIMAGKCVSTGALDSLPLVFAFFVFVGVALSSGLELLVAIFFRFKRTSLYFYSIMTAALGILLYTSGVILLILNLTNPYVSISMILIGWVAMVTGQSVVLYSRLHLIVRNQRMLNWALTMIIVNGTVCHSLQIGFAYKVCYYAYHP